MPKPKIINCTGYLEYGKVIDRTRGSVRKELRSKALENREIILSPEKVKEISLLRGKYYVDHGEYFTLEMFLVIGGYAYHQSGKISKTDLSDGEHYRLKKVDSNLLSREFPETEVTQRHTCNRVCRFREVIENKLGNKKGYCDYPDVYGENKCILSEIERRKEYIWGKVTTA